MFENRIANLECQSRAFRAIFGLIACVLSFTMFSGADRKATPSIEKQAIVHELIVVDSNGDRIARIGELGGTPGTCELLLAGSGSRLSFRTDDANEAGTKKTGPMVSVHDGNGKSVGGTREKRD
jgi:hypothetical protein